MCVWRGEEGLWGQEVLPRHVKGDSTAWVQLGWQEEVGAEGRVGVLSDGQGAGFIQGRAGAAQGLRKLCLHGAGPVTVWVWV